MKLSQTARAQIYAAIYSLLLVFHLVKKKLELCTVTF